MNPYHFYICYLVKKAKPYHKSPGWALKYNPWFSEQELLEFYEVGGVC